MENLEGQSSNNIGISTRARPDLTRSVQPDDVEFPLSQRDVLESSRACGSQAIIEMKSAPKRQKNTFSNSQLEDKIRLTGSKKLNVAQNINRLMNKKGIVQIFINNLRKTAQLLRFEDLSQQQYERVTSNVDNNMFNGRSKISFLNTVPLFEIHSMFKAFSDFLVGIITIVSIVWLPYSISFMSEQLNQQILDVIFIMIILYDSITILNHQTVLRGVVLKDRKLIMKIYLKGDFMFDLLAIVSLLFKRLSGTNTLIIFSIIYIVCRIKRVINILDQLLENFDLSTRMKDVISLINMILTLIFIVHLIACVWHKIGSDQQQEVTWIGYYQFTELSSFYLYSLSFYWAAMTMTTVGYGDITPKNVNEYVFANLTMLVSCIVFGYTLNRIGMLLSHIYLRKAEFNQNLSVLNKYMNKNKVDFELQSQIRSYLDYMWQLENDFHQKEVEVMIQKLPDSLRQELNYQVRSKVINDCKVLTRFSQDLKRKLCSIAEDVCFASNEKILDPSVYQSNPLYIVQSGQIAFENVQLKEMEKQQGQTFGEVSFFTDQSPNIGVTSQGFSSHFKILRSDFLTLLQHFNRDRELFFYIKDSLTFNNHYDKIQLNCTVCDSGGHLINQCPYLHVKMDREKVIKTLLYPTNQPRQQMTSTIESAEEYKRFFEEEQEDEKSSFHSEEQQEDSLTEGGSLAMIQRPSSLQADEKDPTLQDISIQLASIKDKKSNLKKKNPLYRPSQEHLDLEDKHQQIQILDHSKAHPTVKPQRTNSSLMVRGIDIQIEPMKNDLNHKSFDNDQKKFQMVLKPQSDEDMKRKRSQSEGQDKFRLNFMNELPQKRQSKPRLSLYYHHTGQNQQQTQNEIFYHFDKMQKYSNYFPRGNYDVIIQRYTASRQQIIIAKVTLRKLEVQFQSVCYKEGQEDPQIFVFDSQQSSSSTKKHRPTGV